MKGHKLGTVSNVDISSDEDRIFVDVALSPTEFEEAVRYRSPGVGVWFVPEEGDIVELASVGQNRLVAFSPYTVPEFGMPSNLSEGDIAFRLNENTTLHFSENASGGYDVTFECDGDMTIEATDMQLIADSIAVGENGAPVARAGHTHDYSWTDSGGSGTTSEENESGTDTVIE